MADSNGTAHCLGHLISPCVINMCLFDQYVVHDGAHAAMSMHAQVASETCSTSVAGAPT